MLRGIEIKYGNQENWFSVQEGLKHGRGVVVRRNKIIPAGTPLNLFPKGFGSRRLPVDGLDQYMISHGIIQPDKIIIVPHYNSESQENYDEPGWFLNHNTQPNVLHDPTVHPTLFLAAAALLPHTELTIDYMYLREPNPKDYYRHTIAEGPQYKLPRHLS